MAAKSKLKTSSEHPAKRQKPALEVRPASGGVAGVLRAMGDKPLTAPLFARQPQNSELLNRLQRIRDDSGNGLKGSSNRGTGPPRPVMCLSSFFFLQDGGSHALAFRIQPFASSATKGDAAVVTVTEEEEGEAEAAAASRGASVSPEAAASAKSSAKGSAAASAAASTAASTAASAAASAASTRPSTAASAGLSATLSSTNLTPQPAEDGSGAEADGGDGKDKAKKGCCVIL